MGIVSDIFNGIRRWGAGLSGGLVDTDAMVQFEEYSNRRVDKSLSSPGMGKLNDVESTLLERQPQEIASTDHIGDEVKWEEVQPIASHLVDLIIHEDAQCWAKFFCYVYAQAGLLASIGLSLRSQDEVLRAAFIVLASLAGIVLSIGFSYDLNGAVHCLSGHKVQLTRIEAWMRRKGRFGSEHKTLKGQEIAHKYDKRLPAILSNRQGPNRRIVLAGPRWGVLFWIAFVFIAVASLFLNDSTPADDHAERIHPEVSPQTRAHT